MVPNHYYGLVQFLYDNGLSMFSGMFQNSALLVIKFELTTVPVIFVVCKMLVKSFFKH